MARRNYRRELLWVPLLWGMLIFYGVWRGVSIVLSLLVGGAS